MQIYGLNLDKFTPEIRCKFLAGPSTAYLAFRAQESLLVPCYAALSSPSSQTQTSTPCCSSWQQPTLLGRVALELLIFYLNQPVWSTSRYNCIIMGTELILWVVLGRLWDPMLSYRLQVTRNDYKTWVNILNPVVMKMFIATEKKS